MHLQFAYNVKKLQSIHQDLSKEKCALEYCVQQRKGNLQGDTPIESRTNKRCSCWCCCKNPPDVEFYEEKVKQLSDEFEKQKEIALQKPIGTVFISFKTSLMAKDVHDQFNRGTFALWKPKLQKSAMDMYLRTKKWNVEFAPEPEDVYWETLGNTKGARGYHFYKLKYVIVNFGLLLLLLFLSTPCKYDYLSNNPVS